MQSCLTHSSMSPRTLTSCVSEITSRRRKWTSHTSANTQKSPPSPGPDTFSFKERSSSCSSQSASISTKGEVVPGFQRRLSWGCQADQPVSEHLVGLRCYQVLSHLPPAEEPVWGLDRLALLGVQFSPKLTLLENAVETNDWLQHNLCVDLERVHMWGTSCRCDPTPQERQYRVEQLLTGTTLMRTRRVGPYRRGPDKIPGSVSPVEVYMFSVWRRRSCTSSPRRARTSGPLDVCRKLKARGLELNILGFQHLFSFPTMWLWQN